ncbi:MAG: protein kinase, partial [Acidobacteriota bacterium]
VLVTPGGEVKIADFGIARRRPAADAADESLTREGAVVGTYRVMSPEQACGEPPDSRSDLFSFGVLLYELFTSRSPFLADTPSGTFQRILTHTPTPLRTLDPSLPRELSDLVDHLLEKEPALRPWNTGDVASRLRALAGLGGSGSSGGPTVPPTTLMASPGSGSITWLPTGPPTAPPPRRSGRLPGLAAAAGIVLLVAALAAYLLLRPVSSPAPGSSPLHVAVLAPVLRGGAAGEEVEYLRFALRGALQSGLTSLAEVYPRSTSEVDSVAGPPAAVARAMAADEVLETALACKDGSCSVDLSRLRGSDGGATWSGQVEVPLGDLLTATKAVRVL